MLECSSVRSCFRIRCLFLHKSKRLGYFIGYNKNNQPNSVFCLLKNHSNYANTHSCIYTKLRIKLFDINTLKVQSSSNVVEENKSKGLKCTVCVLNYVRILLKSMLNYCGTARTVQSTLYPVR